MKDWIERLLIVAKTYPSPSAKHVETSCVAAINEAGELRRLYPIPFRLIEAGRQFKKWQWIRARITKATDDHRPESHRIYVDTIELDGDPLPTAHEWKARRAILDPLPTFGSFEEIESRRQSDAHTLAFLRPRAIAGLEIERARSEDWTDDERAKLLQAQVQGSLFAQEEEARAIRTLKKVPFDFYYRCICDGPSGEQHPRIKIVDWEAGQLYWNCRRSHGERWEAPFRQRMERELLDRDLLLLLGTIHRFPNQWLSVSLIYPPKQTPSPQLSLL